jgi:hypothetical protein
MEKQTIEMEVLHKEPGVFEVGILIRLHFILSTSKAVEVIRKFFRIFREIFLECVGKFFTRLDDILVRREGKKGNRRDTGTPGRQIRRFYEEGLKTPWGEIRYKCREVKENGTHSIPLRAILGLGPRKQVVEELFDEALELCLFTSFEKAGHMCGNAVSVGKLWGMLQEKGRRILRGIEEAIKYYRAGGGGEVPPAGEIACVMADEIWIREKRSADERKKVNKKEGKTGKRARKWLKVKTALAKVKNPGEPGWRNKTVYASCGSAASFTECAAEYFNGTLGLDGIVNKFCITDGDPFGKKFSSRIGALWLLDFWHLWDHLKVLRVFGKDIRAQVWGLLNVERVDEAFALVRAFLEEIKIHLALREKDEAVTDREFTYMNHIRGGEKSWWERRLKEIERLLSYLSNQRKGIDDYRKLLAYLPAGDIVFGNGPVERTQGTMIAYRMKGQGKTWSKSGAENMIVSQMALCNGNDAEKRIAYLRAQAHKWEIADALPMSSDIEEKVKRKQTWRTAGFPAYHNGKRNSFPYRVSQSVLNGGFMLTKA